MVTGACLAHVGHHVACVDKDEARVALLREGRMPFYEPGLEDLVAEGVSRGSLSFTTDLPEVVRGAARASPKTSLPCALSPASTTTNPSCSTPRSP